MGSEIEVMEMDTKSRPTVVIERIRQAINRHDLEALAACFDPDYRSEFPAHPDRTFGGHECACQGNCRPFDAVNPGHAPNGGW